MNSFNSVFCCHQYAGSQFTTTHEAKKIKLIPQGIRCTEISGQMTLRKMTEPTFFCFNYVSLASHFSFLNNG
jgi:hypothetical protein